MATYEPDPSTRCADCGATGAHECLPAARAELLYETPRGASVVRYGSYSELCDVLRKRAPVGAELRYAGRVVGGVEACDGAGDRCGPRCRRHWWYQVDPAMGDERARRAEVR